MNESRSQMRAEIIQLLQELNVKSIENDSVSNDIVCDEKNSISDLQIRIKALSTKIDEIQCGVEYVSSELKEFAAIIQTL